MPHATCSGWRPKPVPKAESWHGFRKGERVRHRVGSDGIVAGGVGSTVGVRFDTLKPRDQQCDPRNLTRIPAEFKVGDMARVRKERDVGNWRVGAQEITKITRDDDGDIFCQLGGIGGGWFAKNLEHA